MAFISHQAEALTPAENSPSKQEAQEELKEKWKYYASDDEGTDYSYNSDTLKHQKDNRVKVWVQAVYSEKSPKHSQAELQWEIDCTKKSMRGLAARAREKDGTPEDIKTPSKWSPIPAEPTAETLYEILCGKKDKKAP